VAAEKALALVVRGTNWRETSRITAQFDAALGSLRELGNGVVPQAVATGFELVWLHEPGYTPRLDA